MSYEHEVSAALSEITTGVVGKNIEVVALHLDSDSNALDSIFCAHALEQATTEIFEQTTDAHIIVMASIPKVLKAKVNAIHTARYGCTKIEINTTKPCRHLGRDGIACDVTSCENWKPWGNFAGTLKQGYYCSGLLPVVGEDGIQLSPECPQHECERLEFSDLALCVKCSLRKGYCGLERSFE